jgi:hypothetical protein
MVLSSLDQQSVPPLILQSINENLNTNKALLALEGIANWNSGYRVDLLPNFSAEQVLQ